MDITDFVVRKCKVSEKQILRLDGRRAFERPRKDTPLEVPMSKGGNGNGAMGQTTKGNRESV